MLFLRKFLFRSHKKFSKFVNKVLKVKTKKEIEYLKKSAEIASQAYYKIIEIIHEGISEIEVFLSLKNILKKLGSEKEPFDFIVASGPNSAHPHAIPSERKIKLQEPVVLDFGAVYKGFCSDMTRTICLEEPPERLKEIYLIVLEAQKKAIEIIKPGKTCDEIDEVARGIISKAGYKEAFSHNLGHGIGFEVHEFPSLKPGERELLCEGMCLTVEPGIYLAGFGGVRIEDMVYVTENGCNILTSSPKNLKIIK